MISDRKKLTNKEFYDLLLKFAFISNWNTYDCYKVSELAYNMNFVGDTVIKTTMHVTNQEKQSWNEKSKIEINI